MAQPMDVSRGRPPNQQLGMWRFREALGVEEEEDVNTLVFPEQIQVVQNILIAGNAVGDLVLSMSVQTELGTVKEVMGKAVVGA